MNITPILLKDLSFDLKHTPLWGLARLNEYTNQQSVLRIALLRKFESEIQEFSKSRSTSKIVQKLTSGALLNELSKDEQLLVKAFSKKTQANVQIMHVFSKRISYQERKIKLDREFKIA